LTRDTKEEVVYYNLRSEANLRPFDFKYSGIREESLVPLKGQRVGVVTLISQNPKIGLWWIWHLENNSQLWGNLEHRNPLTGVPP
jgi:hypothetical protein